MLLARDGLFRTVVTATIPSSVRFVATPVAADILGLETEQIISFRLDGDFVKEAIFGVK
jgi:hypothetical protein